MTPLGVASGVMAALFVFAVIVQHNDPDPVRWMAIYGAAAAVSAVFAAGRRPRWPPALVGAAALGWGATLVPRVASLPPGQLFSSWGMTGAAMEEGRELGGLVIVALWMSVLFAAARSARTIKA